ncbi:MAG: hypothetical protein O9302_04655 [Cyclobacteriaceae bacterium]|nr:hypothetical protein [Flammeovirgaceae bacterium]MCZ8022949.1 hypothetical protein [Cytophagales bacterium]MCZ8327325.1 hypothetical protein [Cyclobacteriaceae bacterium]
MKALLKTFALFFITISVYAQHQSIGLRVGNPTGFTYKKYLANSTGAIEAGFGTVSAEQSARYYRKSFKDYSSFANQNYVSHTVNSTLVLQGRYLFQYPWELSGAGKYEWYWGLGGLLKLANVTYTHSENSGNSLLRTTKKNDIDLGIEIPLGMEYTFEDAPITLFGEVGPFIELTNRTGVMQVKGALGIRYNFYQKL